MNFKNSKNFRGDIFGEKHLNREAIVRFWKVESKDFGEQRFRK